WSLMTAWYQIDGYIYPRPQVVIDDRMVSDRWIYLPKTTSDRWIYLPKTTSGH
ncbi:6493_t:CDS:2, partial [Entrophospora sp. SA101]